MSDEKNAPADGSVYDVVIVGGGAAGLSAALLLGRARRSVMLVDAGEPRNAPAPSMHGFLSRDGMAPAALLEAGRAEVAGYGVALVESHVEQIQADHLDDSHVGFLVRLIGGPTLKARRVIVATGLHDELPEIPGVPERWGKDLLHCPYCHGYEVRDQPIGVLGTGPGAVRQGLLLRQWSSDIVFFSHTLNLTDGERERLTARGVQIVEGEIERLVVEDDRLHGVELAGGHVIPRHAVFVFPRMVPRDGLLTGLGCAQDDNGWLVTDRSGRTSVPGVWAVGNLADPRAQVITAAGMGSAAAFAVDHDLLEEDVADAVAVGS